MEVKRLYNAIFAKIFFRLCVFRSESNVHYLPNLSDLTSVETFWWQKNEALFFAEYFKRRTRCWMPVLGGTRYPFFYLLWWRSKEFVGRQSASKISCVNHSYSKWWILKNIKTKSNFLKRLHSWHLFRFQLDPIYKNNYSQQTKASASSLLQILSKESIFKAAGSWWHFF